MHKSYRDFLKDGIRKKVDFSRTGHIRNASYLAAVGKAATTPEDDE
jgi:hypothetical protein